MSNTSTAEAAIEQLTFFAIEERSDDTSPAGNNSTVYDYAAFNENAGKLAYDNYSIDPALLSGNITPKERYARNISAIRLLHQIEAEDRQATPEEQGILSRYIGFGGIPQVFDPQASGWGNEHTELKSLLPEKEYAAARASVLSAYYTPPAVIQAIYRRIEAFGILKGNALEPSFGSGNFIGLLPDSMKGIRFHGTELDPVTARIAKLLYPKASLHACGFESSPFPDSFFDLAIGNVPFGGYKVSDPKYDRLGLNIHDYFFAKTIDLVRPGGVIAYITSKGTLDKGNSRFRQYMAERCELLGAVRLPNFAFKEYAGTSVTSDIIFLQKRESLSFDVPSWVNTAEGITRIPYNSYFHENPHMMLGDMSSDSSILMYRNESCTTCAPNFPCHELEERLSNALSNIRCSYAEVSTDDIEGEIGEPVPADGSVKNFSYAIDKGRLYFREDSIMSPVVLPQTTKERIAGMINLRDCLAKLIDMQAGDAGEDELSAQRSRLSYLYNKFVRNYGLVNSSANAKAFSKDSSYYLICSLEVFDSDGNFERKADIFTKRTVNRKPGFISAGTSSEALSISMSNRGRPDLEYMSRLSGKSPEEIISDLKGVLFLDITKNLPAPMDADCDPSQLKLYQRHPVVTADEYLSGNVRAKLKTTLALRDMFGYDDIDLSTNIEALKAVQPKDIEAHEIFVKLGSSWVDPCYIEQFMHELLEVRQHEREYRKVIYFPDTATWNIPGKNSAYGDILATVTYGTKRATAFRIIEDTLNLRDVRIYDTAENPDGSQKTVLNKKETMLASQKQELIKEKFREWIFADQGRRKALTEKYNIMFNSTRPREYDGAFVDLAGMSPSIKLNPHQTAAVARILYGGNTLLAHEVGAGKTFVMAAAIMESRRLGLCNKAMMCVPNHITEQIASEFLRLYPSASILVATARDFEAKNRKKLCARIATGDYDCIIIGHSQLAKIPVSKERMTAALEKEIEEIIINIEKVKASRGERFTIKQLEKTRRTIEAKLKKLNEGGAKDDVVTFEQLGIDRLFIDESHYFKNLYIITKMRNVAGLSTEDAQKTSDLYMKTRYMDEITGGKGVIFATGTPISNSMSELYSLHRYLQGAMLEEKGITCFDAWASSFAETVTSMELAPEGNGYRARTRFSKFNNLPELMNIFKECADIKTSDMLDLPKPKAIFETIVAKPTPDQRELVKQLSARAKAVSERRVKPTEDNMLKITTDGRKIGLDQRLIDPKYPDDPDSKVNLCFKNVLRIYRETEENRLTQIIFCDFSTPGKGGFNVYDDIKAKLVSEGVPEEEIAFIHDANTDARKKALFGAVKTGKVRILMGSTQKCGAGTNVQDKLIAIHDLDCPWRPSDLAQRAGRIIRQGNGNETVYVYRYVTDATFDAYLFQTLEKKQEFISQIMTSKTPVRACEDIDEDTLSYAEIKSLCAGNPLIKEKMELDIKVSKLKILKSDHLANQHRLQDFIMSSYPAKKKSAESLLEQLKLDAEAQSKLRIPKDAKGEPLFSITVMGKEYTERKAAGYKILEECNFLDKSKRIEIGSYHGFPLFLRHNGLTNEYTVDICLNANHDVPIGSDPAGAITRIQNAFGKIGERLKQQEETISRLSQQLESAKAEYGKPFPGEAELEQAVSRLAEINFILVSDASNGQQEGGDNMVFIPEFDDEQAA